MSNPEVERAREEVIEAFAGAAEAYGFNQSHGRLYGVLFFESEPLSLDALAEQTDYSKSTASTVMRDLETLRMVRRRTTGGVGPRVYFEAQRDFWQVLEELLQRYAGRELRIMSAALDDAERRLAGVDSEAAAEDQRRVRELQSIYAQLEGLLSLLDRHSVEELVGMLGQDLD